MPGTDDRRRSRSLGAKAGTRQERREGKQRRGQFSRSWRGKRRSLPKPPRGLLGGSRSPRFAKLGGTSVPTRRNHTPRSADTRCLLSWWSAPCVRRWTLALNQGPDQLRRRAGSHAPPVARSSPAIAVAGIRPGRQPSTTGLIIGGHRLFENIDPLRRRRAE